MYWSYRSIPELKALPRERQDALWRAHCRAYLGAWQAWAWLLPTTFAFVAIGSHLLHTLGDVLGGAASGLVTGEVAVFYARRAIRRELATERADLPVAS